MLGPNPGFWTPFKVGFPSFLKNRSPYLKQYAQEPRVAFELRHYVAEFDLIEFGFFLITEAISTGFFQASNDQSFGVKPCLRICK